MARYSEKAAGKVGKVMHEYKEGSLKSGKSGKTVKSRKQAMPRYRHAVHRRRSAPAPSIDVLR